MTKKNKQQPLHLFKKSIIFALQSLKQQQQQLTIQIEKKTMTINTFRAYLTEYQQSTHGKQSQSTQQVINQNAFLNQIAKTLLNEQETLVLLMQKQEQCTAEFQAQIQQIKLIEQTIKEAEKKRLDMIDWQIEQMSLDQWMQHKAHLDNN